MSTAVLGAEGGFLVGGPPGAVIGGLIGLGIMAAIGIYAMTHADNEADKQLDAAPADEACKSCGSSGDPDDPEQKEKDAEKGLQDRSRPGRETKGKTKQFDTDGGKEQLDKDFDSFGPKNPRNIPTTAGPGRTGELPSGRTITERPGSTDGRPTLEIRRPNGRIDKYRYNP